MNDLNLYDWDDLIKEDKVHQSIYTDPDIFNLEMERIYGTSWVYVGHGSQIPNAGDYYTTTIGRHPVVMVRHKDNTIKVLYNRCAHKGAQVVSQTYGNAKAFRCGYHGWRYDTDGRLLTVPLQEGYDNSAFCPRASTQGNMPEVANYREYRGFIFASLSADAIDFESWIGGIDSSIDNMVDRSPEGELEIVKGSLRYLMNCNWKFHVENLNDLMHPMVAHQSSSQAGKVVANRHFKGDEKKPMAIEIISPFTNKYAFFDDMGLNFFDHGHSYSGGKISIHSAYSDISEYQRMMEKAYGKERTSEIFSENRHNTVLYPNLTIKGAIQTIRVCHPIAVDKTLIESFVFKLKGAPEEILQRSVLYSNLINSSAGLVQPDDHECYIRLQNGLHAKGNEWVNMQRYMGQEKERDDLGWKAIGSSDAVFRNQYKAWKNYMSCWRVE